MPISEKIKAEIGNLRHTDDEKELILKILEAKDNGMPNLESEIETLIIDHITKGEQNG